MNNRTLDAIKYVLIGAIIVLALAVVAVLTITQTQWGVERARGYAVTWLKAQVHGTVKLGRITSTGLLGGAVIHDLSIIDQKGRPFLSVDSARVAYDWRTFLNGDIVLGALDLYNPKVVVEQLPGDKKWNYEYIFADTTNPNAPSLRRLIEVHRVRAYNGSAIVRMPFEVKGHAIVPGDTARMLIEKMPRGLVRVFRFANVNATLPRVLWESPQETGKIFQFSSASGKGWVYVDPFDLRDARGRVGLRDSVVSFDVPMFRAPNSTGSIFGRVVTPKGENIYDIKINADRFSFADARWIYPRLPDGGGAMGLRIQTLPRGTLWLVTDARLRAPGTNVAGTFGVVTGDTTYFTRVSLRASPLNLKVIEDMLPGTLPVKGLLVGTVVVEGPLSSLTTRGDVKLAGTGTSAGSAVKWQGTVDLRKPYGARNLKADLSDVDLGLVEALKQLHMSGALTGHVEASGNLGSSLRFTAKLQHKQNGRGTSDFEGTGDIGMRAGARTFDVRAKAQPMALDALAAAIPSLRTLTGQARGPINVSGTMSDMHVDADLETPAGRLNANARFDLSSKIPHYRADGRITGFHLDSILSSLPSGSIDARFAVTGQGGTLDDTRTRGRLQIESGKLQGLPIRGGLLEFAVADGLAHVDSARLAFDAGYLSASGTFGLTNTQRGTLHLNLVGDSLASLRPLVFPNGAPPDVPGAPPPLDGSVRGSATLIGNNSSFDISGQATLQRFLYVGAAATGGALRFTGNEIGSPRAHWTTEASADSLSYGARAFRAFTLAGEYGGGTGDVRVSAKGGSANEDHVYRFASALRRVGDELSLAVRELAFGPAAELWTLTKPTQLGVTSNGIDVHDAVIASAAGGTVRADGAIGWHRSFEGDVLSDDHPIDFHVTFDKVHLEEFFELARPDVPGDGLFTAQLNARGSASAPIFDGKFSVADLHYGDVKLQHLEGDVGYDNKRLTLTLGANQGTRRVLTGRGTIPLNLVLAPTGPRRLADPLDYHIAADSVPAALVAALVPGLRSVEGFLNGVINFSGTAKDPALAGTLTLAGGAASVDATGVRYNDVQGRFDVKPGNVVVVLGSAKTGGAKTDVSGQITFKDLINPDLKLDIHADGLLAARRRDVVLTTSGDMKLGGKFRSPILSGGIRVDKGALYIDEVYRQYLIQTLDSPLLFDVVDTSIVAVKRILPTAMSSDFMKNLVIDNFNIDVGRDAWLRSREMNVEVTGQLSVTYDARHSEDVRMSGTLDAVRGSYQLKGRRFQVRNGTVEFVGTTGLDPNLNIVAVYRVATAQGDPLNIQATVSGTLQSPRIALSSDAQPAISESDLVSYLVFGRASDQLTAGERAAAGTTVSRSGVAGFGNLAYRILTPSLLGYAATGLESFAQNLGLDYVAITSAEVAQGPLSGNLVSSLFAGSQVELGRYLNDNLFLAFSQRLMSATAGGSRSPGVRLEWRFQPTYTAELFAEDRFARTPSFGLLTAAEAKKVYGFFLFREWGY